MTKHPGIHFEGVVSRHALWSVLGGLDVLVVPSLWYEGSPANIREAFAAGVPVVASRVGALPEMIRDGIDGLLFPTGDETALRDILQSLLDDRSQLSRLQANIVPVLSFDEHVGMVMDVYQEALTSTING